MIRFKLVKQINEIIIKKPVMKKGGQKTTKIKNLEQKKLIWKNKQENSNY